MRPDARTRRGLLYAAAVGTTSAVAGCAGTAVFQGSDPLEGTRMTLRSTRVDEPLTYRYVRALDEMRDPKRERYRGAILEGHHVLDSTLPRGRDVLFVEYDGIHYRVDRTEVELRDGSTVVVYSRADSFSTLEALREGHVGVTIVPIRRDVLPDTYEVFETAVLEGEYESAPMTERDCRAWIRIADEFDDVLEVGWTARLYWYDGAFYYVGWGFRNRPQCAEIVDD